MNANDFIENIKTQNISLPIIYLNSSWYQKYKNLLYTIVNDFKGIAFVVCCKNINTDKFIHNEFNLTRGSYYFFSSHDIQKILYRNLNNDEMLSLISRKIKDYVTKIDYDLTVNKVNLNFLQEINKNEKTKEEDILLSVEDELHSLKYKADELSHKIMELENEILALEAENDYLTSSLQVQDKFPVLIKGDEQEFYEGEQKDMVLYLLEQEIKNTVNDSNNDTKMIKSILETNEKIGIRDTYLDELKKLLWPMRKLNESSIEKLRKYGIIIRKGPTHYDSKFFDDPRYIIPPASTPSDMYAFHEMFRQIKKWFF